MEPLIRCCPGFSTEFIQVTELNEGEVVPKSKSGTACGVGSFGVKDKAGAGAGLWEKSFDKNLIGLALSSAAVDPGVDTCGVAGSVQTWRVGVGATGE